jgi:hypothetical protein
VDYLGHAFNLPGDDSQDSWFYGHTDARRHWYPSLAIGDFTVRTDEHTYDVNELKRKGDPMGTGSNAGMLVAGFTDKRYPYVNAIAVDAGFTAGLRGSEFFGLWVYELGNSLAAITGENPATPADAKERYGRANEAGSALSDCVFGGRLNSSGSVPPPR